MKIPGAVQRETHQETIGLEKLRPLRRDRHAVGLDGVVHGNVGGDKLPLHGHKIPEEVQPRQGGLTPLEGNLNNIPRLG